MKRNFRPRARLSLAVSQNALEKILSGTGLAGDEVARLLECPYQFRFFQAGAEIACREGEECFAVSGWASFRLMLPDGRRQIAGFALPGDILGGGPRDVGMEVVALTPVTVVDFSRTRIGGGDARLAAALDKAVAQAKRRREGYLLGHVLRLGSMNAMQRMLHLFEEIEERLRRVGLANHHRFALPVTQETLGETLGLSSVHVSRVLAQLRRHGVLAISGGELILKHSETADEIGEDFVPAGTGFREALQTDYAAVPGSIP